ncbi:DUF853 domain-containing protein [Desulfurococcaceae archaeon AG1]|nr:MAG: hypothetical protein DJ555_04470 [Desulfurococcaceae archaeon]GAY26586.1 DUF853 domain-containing protein [Desulfurococcaceae archaeon AG1]
MLLFRKRNKLQDRARYDNVFEIDIGGRSLYASGFEVLVKVTGKRDRGSARDSVRAAIENMIYILRERMPRSSQIYVVTRITKYLGGTVVICVDKKVDVGQMCRLASSTIEALSDRSVKIRELSEKEILESLVIHRKYGGSFLDMNAFFAEEASPYVDELPVPMIPQTSEGVLIGETIRSKIKQKIYLPLDTLTRHIAIFGSTGSGKSTTAAAIAVRSRAKGVKVIILDWHGEYRDLVGRSAEHRYIRINMPIVSTMLSEFISKPTYILEILESVLDLTPAQSYLLSTVLRSLGNISGTNIFTKIASLLEDYKGDARWVSETRFSLMRKIQLLADEEARSPINNDVLSHILSPGLSIIDLSEMERESLKSLSSLVILKVTELLSKNNKEFMATKKLVIVDEAHHVFRRTEGGSVIGDMLAETRKWNLGLVIVSQSPSSLGENSLKNTNTKIIHAIKSDIDRKVIKDSIVIPNDIEGMLPALGVGEAVIASPAYDLAVLAKIYPP